MTKYYLLRSHEDSDLFYEVKDDQCNLTYFDDATIFSTRERAEESLIKFAGEWYRKGYIMNLVEIDLVKNTFTILR